MVCCSLLSLLLCDSHNGGVCDCVIEYTGYKSLRHRFSVTAKTDARKVLVLVLVLVLVSVSVLNEIILRKDVQANKNILLLNTYNKIYVIN